MSFLSRVCSRSWGFTEWKSPRSPAARALTGIDKSLRRSHTRANASSHILASLAGVCGFGGRDTVISGVSRTMAEISLTATVLTASSSSSRESHAYTNNQEKTKNHGYFNCPHYMLLLVSLLVGTFYTRKQFDGKTYSGKYQPTLRYICIYTHP